MRFNIDFFLASAIVIGLSSCGGGNIDGTAASSSVSNIAENSSTRSASSEVNSSDSSSNVNTSSTAIASSKPSESSKANTSSKASESSVANASSKVSSSSVASSQLATISSENNASSSSPVVPPPPALLAAFTHQSLLQNVTVDAYDSYVSDGAISNYSWDFGDGSTASGVSAVHTYASTGDFPVTLTITDTLGNSTASTQTLTVPSYRTGFEDGVTGLGCTTREPNHSQPFYISGSPLGGGLDTGSTALKFFWTQSAYDKTRLKRGTETCPPVNVLKEAWVGFMFYLPSFGYPMDKSAAMFQIFQQGYCNSWASLMTIINNSITVSHRHYCGDAKVGALLQDIPRDTWIPVIVHIVVSHANKGMFQVWMNGAPKETPTYNATNINFGFGTWLSEDTLDPSNPITIKFGQYNYDDNYTIGETRTSYYDNIHMLSGNRADAWEAVNPVGASLPSSLALMTSDAQPREGARAAQAFDGNSSTKWQSVNSPAAWLLYRFPAKQSKAVTAYRITSSDNVGRDPRGWQFEASNDGVNWIVLDTQNNQVFGSRGANNSYSIANTTSYSYYRLNITQNNGAGDIQVAELALTYPE